MGLVCFFLCKQETHHIRKCSYNLLCLAFFNACYSKTVSVTDKYVMCFGSDQLVVQTVGAVVGLGLGVVVQSRRQRQGQGVSVGQIPEPRSDVSP